MRLLGSLLLPTVLLATLLVPATGMAAWTHSWCTPGDPLVLPAPSGTHPNSVNVVDWVCAEGGLPNCCATGGRWSVECVQRGASHAKQVNWLWDGTSDYCGRYAWAQGPIGSNKQYYPRDFNLFALSTSTDTTTATGFTDVQGPVAAAGAVKASSFNLSHGRQEDIALIAKGGVDLTNGTVYGNIIYGTTYTGHGSTTNVSASDPTRPAVPQLKDPLAIDFATVSTKLLDMSKALARYTATRATKLNNRVTFKGTDSELNVFSVYTSDLANAFEYVIDVPKGSSVIINFIGSSANFMNAGFTGPNGGGLSGLPISPRRILWNFLDATQLTIQSVSFPGSILAPKARATFRWGSLSGTAVVNSAVSSSELYMARYQIPGPGGCHWDDPKWSCTNDTTLDDARHAADIAAEAGFLEIEGGGYTAENQPRSSPTHRIWYSFQPAGPTPKSAPLAVFFNGGPGSSTSAMLFSFNTAPMTLDPDPAVTHGQKVAYNPSGWTKFANLLYIDAPGTGFSYPLPCGTGLQDLGIDIDRDAGIFLRVVVGFLTRHPALLGRVILVGESYGGTRATLMLEYLFGYLSVAPGSGAAYQDAQLSSELGNYFQEVFGKPPTPSQILNKFAHQVLIQPGLVGSQQQDQEKDWMVAGCADARKLSDGTLLPCYLAGQDPVTKNPIQPTCDRYDCDKLNKDQPNNQEWIFYQVDEAAKSLGDIATLNRALSVDVTTIQWMYPSERVGAWGREDGFSSDDMNNKFGHLPVGDTYFVTRNDNAGAPYAFATPDPSRQWYDAGISIGTSFLNNVSNGVASFIPIAVFDSMIRPPSISYALDAGAFDKDPNGPFSTIISKVDFSLTSPAYLPRHGGMSIVYKSGPPKTVVMPNAYAAGHTIVMRAQPAANLLADIMQWYSQSPH